MCCLWNPKDLKDVDFVLTGWMLSINCCFLTVSGMKPPLDYQIIFRNLTKEWSFVLCVGQEPIPCFGS